MTQKIRDFYNAGMDSMAINKRGYGELLPYFEKIDQMSDKSQLAMMIGQLHVEGFKPFFTAGRIVDWKNFLTKSFRKAKFRLMDSETFPLKISTSNA